MKLKKAAILILTVSFTMIPMFTFAYRSKDYSGSSSSTTTKTTVGVVGSGSAGTSVPTTDTTVHVSASGAIVSTTGTTTDKTGTVIGLVVDTKTSDGKTITSNKKGGVTIGNLSIHFADGIAETGGLPTDIVDKINKLNHGGSIKDVLGSDIKTDLTCFEKFGNTRAVIVYDATTELTHTATELVLHLDVKPGMELAAVYYDNNTGRWEYVPVVIDLASSTVKVMVPGSCTLQLVKKASPK